MNGNSICNHRFLAGFLAFLMFWSLFLGGICLSLRMGALGSGSLTKFMEKSDLYDSVCEIFDASIEKEMKNGELNWILENESYEEIKEEMVKMMFVMIEGKDKVDIANLVDMFIGAVEEESDKLVDDVMGEIENVGEDFDARENKYVQNIIDTYSLKVGDEFYDELNKYAQHADEIEKYEDEIKEEIDNKVIKPARDQADEMTVDMQADFDKKLEKFYDSEGYDAVKVMNKAFEMVSILSLIASIVLLGLAVLYMVIIILLYRRGIYGAFSKFIAPFTVSGIFLLLFGAIKFVAAPLLDQVAKDVANEYDGNIKDIILNIVDKFVDSIFTPFIIIGVVYIVIMIVCIIMKSILKGIYKSSRDDNNYNGYGNGYGNAAYNTNYNNYNNGYNNPYAQQGGQNYNQQNMTEQTTWNGYNNDNANNYTDNNQQN